MPDLSIQNAFLEGMQEVYRILFTESMLFSYLDEYSTDVSIYDESTNKAYKEPIALKGKIIITPVHGENPVEGTKYTSVITIPTKEFIDNNIDYSPTGYDLFKKGKFSYQGVNYLVEEVKPLTLVADIFHFYQFSCTTIEKDTLRGE